MARIKNDFFVNLTFNVHGQFLYLEKFRNMDRMPQFASAECWFVVVDMSENYIGSSARVHSDRA